jgi:pimeloyl-ACP methyl ester carboxylesterase
MSITTVGARIIHYEALGRGEPLIFVHGWLGSWRYWWPSMQSLSTHYRTFALDLWGFGDSSKDPSAYHLDAYATMLDEFVEKLGIARPVTLVGHALGAAAALRYASAHPAAVSRLAAVALPLSGAHLNSRLLDADPAALLGRVLKASHPEVEGELRKTDAGAIHASAAELNSLDFGPALSEPPVPLLLVYGSADALVLSPNSHIAGEPAAGAGENCAVITLEASHFPMLEDAPRFNRLLLDFIRAETNPTAVAPKEFWQRRVH